MRLIEITDSTRIDKKLMAIFDVNGYSKITHFGAAGYMDYTLYYKQDPKLAEIKKAAYIARHSVRENFEDPTSAGSLSYWILWNKPTVDESIIDYKNHFQI